MRPTLYRCNKCSFSGTTTSTWGHYYYLIGEQQIPLDRHIGICYDCNSITPVEKLPDGSRLNSIKDKLLNDPQFPTMLENDYMEEKKRIQLLDDRVSPEKCLKCGGTDIVIITDNKIREGLIHRSCGGLITEKIKDVDFYMGRMPPKYYDLEGNRILK